MDGIYYASVARNLAEGIGTFWDPEFTKTHLSTFHEHPPLVFGLMSLLFRSFGDAFWVERLYSLLVLLLSGWVLLGIWKESRNEENSISHPLPILFAVSIPLLHWAASNNVLESTMMLFLLLATLFFVRSFHRHTLFYTALGGIMIFAGALCKGAVALFPLSFFFWRFCSFSEYRSPRMLRDTAWAVLFTLLPLGSILLSQEAYAALKDYFLNQIVQGISNRETVDSRFFIVERLIGELLPVFGIAVLLFFISRLKGKEARIRKRDMEWGFIFIATGLSGVLPIMISKTQGGFYIIPALPFFCLGFAHLFHRHWTALLSHAFDRRENERNLALGAVLLFAIGILIHSFRYGDPGADSKKVELVEEVGRTVEDGRTIHIDPTLKADFGLHAYFQRYERISLDADTSSSKEHKAILLPGSGASWKELPSSYEEHPLQSRAYRLFLRKESKASP